MAFFALAGALIVQPASKPRRALFQPSAGNVRLLLPGFAILLVYKPANLPALAILIYPIPARSARRVNRNASRSGSDPGRCSPPVAARIRAKITSSQDIPVTRYLLAYPIAHRLIHRLKVRSFDHGRTQGSHWHIGLPRHFARGRNAQRGRRLDAHWHIALGCRNCRARVPFR
jgi:hypothetical protein